MAISIGDALLKVGVDTKDLDRGMKGIGATIKKHQKAIGIGMTVMGGAILAAGALSIKTFAEMGDEIQKMALRTGFATESLSEWKHALEISGASLQTLEKGIKRMSTSIIDAQDGLLESVRNFDKLGIEVEDLIGLSPEEQFEMIAMALADVEDQTTKAAIAQKLFGRAGMDLLPMLAAGADGIKELREEAHRLGIVFDQEAADKAAEFTDAMHRLDESMSGVKMAIAEQLIPILLPLLDHVKNIISGISTWAKAHPDLTKVILIATGALAGLLLVLGPLLIMLPTLATSLGIVTGAMHAFNLAMLLNPIGLVVAAIMTLIAIIAVLAMNWEQVTKMFTDAWVAIREGAVSAFEAVRDIVKNVTDWVMTLFDAVKQLWEMLQRMLATFRQMPTPLQAMIGGTPGEAVRARREEIRRSTTPSSVAMGFQRGGIVRETGLAMVHKGEAIIPAGQPTIEVIVHNYLDGNELENYISQKIIKEVRLQGNI